MADLRTKFLNGKKFKSKTITVSVPDGDEMVDLEVVVKQPSVDEATQIQGAFKVSNAQAAALAIVLCVKNPENGNSVFEHADIPALLEMPAGSWVNELGSQVVDLVLEAQEAAKKS